jgi:hypothetical protein
VDLSIVPQVAKIETGEWLAKSFKFGNYAKVSDRKCVLGN